MNLLTDLNLRYIQKGIGKIVLKISVVGMNINSDVIIGEILKKLKENWNSEIFKCGVG